MLVTRLSMSTLNSLSIFPTWVTWSRVELTCGTAAEGMWNCWVELRGLAEAGPDDVTRVVVPVSPIPRPYPNGWEIEGRAGATVKFGGATLLLGKGGSSGKVLPGWLFPAWECNGCEKGGI